MPLNADSQRRVEALFQASIAASQRSMERLAPDIATAGGKLASALASGNKVLCCGNGGSAADAQHFAAELVNRFEIDRPALPAIALTTDSSTLTSIANDAHFDDVFARQIQALAVAGDCLVANSTSGNSPNIVRAIEAAHDKGVMVILLSGRDGGAARKTLNQGDMELCVPAQQTARIQEVHIVILHCLCDLIDHLLFGCKENLTS